VPSWQDRHSLELACSRSTRESVHTSSGEERAPAPYVSDRASVAAKRRAEAAARRRRERVMPIVLSERRATFHVRKVP